MLKILHINVRLFEGGASRIALDLHKNSNQFDFQSTFAYGYGKGGKPSIVEDEANDIFCLTKRLRVYGNYILHRLFGIDFIKPDKKKIEIIENEIISSDIVHLHVIHSYFIPYKWLLSILIKYDKKVVWTVHDRWVLTGRCAITGKCQKWQTNCGKCEFLDNYPSTVFDLSRNQSQKKEKLINRMKKNLFFIAVSNDIYKDIKLKYRNIRTDIINNGVDSEFRKIANKIILNGSENNVKLKVLIVGMNLADPQKIDFDLINKISKIDNCEIITIGNNSQIKGDNIRNIGIIINKREMVHYYSIVDVTLFTSTIDTFGLVIAESLSCGTPVLAKSSEASKEVLSMVNSRALTNDEIIDRINNRKFLDLYKVSSREELRKLALDKFSSNKMLEKYYDLYLKLYLETKGDIHKKRVTI